MPGVTSRDTVSIYPYLRYLSSTLGFFRNEEESGGNRGRMKWREMDGGEERNEG